MLKWWWKDNWERALFFGFLCVLMLLCVVKIKLPVPEFMASSFCNGWVAFFQAKSFEDIVGDLLTGIASAYVFYIFIELLPRFHREKSALLTLNYILASVVDAYVNVRGGGHEDLISLNDTSLLQGEKTKEILAHLAKIRAKRKFTNHEYLKLRLMLGCVDSRLHDFRAALPLAATLSPTHALYWLQLSDRARHDS
ncbi:UNVERIFIED_ORG: hypothetical protein J2W87_001419 [Pseudomonas putida]|nr:hypothetical protein [Pseudomonas putida]